MMKRQQHRGTEALDLEWPTQLSPDARDDALRGDERKREIHGQNGADRESNPAERG
jgi:hypothetical protein